MSNPDFTRPTNLYKKQHDAIFCPHRWALVECGTKAGITTVCLAWLLERAFGGQFNQGFWWIAPTSALSYAAFQSIKRGLTQGSFIPKEYPVPSINLPNGATIVFRAGDNPMSLNGTDVFAAVIDGAAECKEESWHNLRSTLTATEGPARIVGKVKGRNNWFYHLARRVEAGEVVNSHYARLTTLDAVEAGIISRSEVEDARQNLPEMIFRELYMTEPCDERLEKLADRRCDPRILSDEELALYANIDPSTIDKVTNEALKQLMSDDRSSVI